MSEIHSLPENHSNFTRNLDDELVPMIYEAKREGRFKLMSSSEIFKDIACLVSAMTPLAGRYDSLKKQFVFDDFVLTFVNTVSPSVEQSVFKAIDQDDSQHYNFTLNEYGPVGDLVSLWRLHDCKLKAVEFGGHDADSDALKTTKLTFSPARIELVY